MLRHHDDESLFMIFYKQGDKKGVYASCMRTTARPQLRPCTSPHPHHSSSSLLVTHPHSSSLFTPLHSSSSLLITPHHSSSSSLFTHPHSSSLVLLGQQHGPVQAVHAHAGRGADVLARPALHVVHAEASLDAVQQRRRQANEGQEERSVSVHFFKTT